MQRMNRSKLFRRNLREARKIWHFPLTHSAMAVLETLTEQFGFVISTGDLLFTERGWYVTNVGLLRLARRRRCRAIQVEPVESFSDPSLGRFAFKATVYPSKDSSGFVGYGDADPSNVSPLVRGAEMRIAETRAVNRALRKAYGIGICSVEELGALPNRVEPAASQPRKLPPQSVNGNGNGGPRVRDRLCQIIRQHQLDPDLVKAYAVDFCGTETLKEASRAQVENFVEHLADWAQKDRNALLCQLNSYLPPRKIGNKEEGEEKAGAA